MLMQQLASGDNDTDGNGSISVKSFEVFEIPIVEGILVIPFDLQS